MPSLRGPMIAIVLAPLFTLLTYIVAVKSAAGETIEVTGRRRALKQLIVSVGESLGPIGTLAVGAVATVLAAVWLVRTVQVRRAMPVAANDPGTNLTAR